MHASHHRAAADWPRLFLLASPLGPSESIDNTGKIRVMKEGDRCLHLVSGCWKILWKKAVMAPKAQLAQVFYGLQGQTWPLRLLRGCNGLRGHQNIVHSQCTLGPWVFKVVYFKSEVNLLVVDSTQNVWMRWDIDISHGPLEGLLAYDIAQGLLHVQKLN